MAYSFFDLTGKTVLVTGANAGIGYGMADALAEAGARLIVWGRRADRNEAAAQAFRRHGGEVVTREVDIADEAAVETAFAEAVAHAGRLDAVFANAGRSGPNLLADELDTASYRSLVETNQFGTFYTMRAGAHHMRQVVSQGGPPGSLVITGSTSMLWGAPRNSAYAMTKGALDALTRTMAAELGPLGIRVNCILPGAIATEIGHKVAGSPWITTFCAMKRSGGVEEMGGIAVYLASDASSYHTGSSIVVDGGLSIHKG